MTRLLSFEFYKRYRSYRAFFCGVAALEILSQLIMAILLFFKAPDQPLIIAFIISSLGMFAILAVPPIENIWRFNYDISGKVAPLELSLPQPAWKKVLAKLIATLCTLVGSIVFDAAVFLIDVFILVNFKASAALLMIPKFINPSDAVILFLMFLLTLAFMTCLIFMCIALAKSISHKNKIAVPVSIGAFIAVMIITSLLGWLATFIPVGSIMIAGQPQQISQLIAEAIFAFLAFLGTSWLVEKKIEA